MPIYEYKCSKCDKNIEEYQSMGSPAPVCCGEPMTKKYSFGRLTVKMGKALWMERMDDIHKAQAQRGERLRFVHPSEIGANAI